MDKLLDGDDGSHSDCFFRIDLCSHWNISGDLCVEILGQTKALRGQQFGILLLVRSFPLGNIVYEADHVPGCIGILQG